MSRHFLKYLPLSLPLTRPRSPLLSSQRNSGLDQRERELGTSRAVEAGGVHTTTTYYQIAARHFLLSRLSLSNSRLIFISAY